MEGVNSAINLMFNEKGGLHVSRRSWRNNASIKLILGKFNNLHVRSPSQDSQSSRVDCNRGEETSNGKRNTT